MKATWDDFCGWIREYMEVDIPISWESIESLDGRIIRIDLFKERPFHVTTAVPDESRLCNHDIAYALTRSLEGVLRRAIKKNAPMTYLEYFGS